MRDLEELFGDLRELSREHGMNPAMAARHIVTVTPMPLGNSGASDEMESAMGSMGSGKQDRRSKSKFTRHSSPTMHLFGEQPPRDYVLVYDVVLMDEPSTSSSSSNALFGRSSSGRWALGRLSDLAGEAGDAKSLKPWLQRLLEIVGETLVPRIEFLALRDFGIPGVHTGPGRFPGTISSNLDFPIPEHEAEISHIEGYPPQPRFDASRFPAQVQGMLDELLSTCQARSLLRLLNGHFQRVYECPKPMVSLNAAFETLDRRDLIWHYEFCLDRTAQLYSR